MDDLDRECLVSNCADTIIRKMWGAYRDDIYVSVLQSVARLAAKAVIEQVEAEQARLST